MKRNKGVLSGILAYIIWGVLPLYWKTVKNIDSRDLLAYRIIFSCIVLIGAVLLLGKTKEVIQETKILFKSKSKLAYLLLGVTLISANWLLFITTVNAGNTLDASLGYYINPILSVILGIYLLKEKASHFILVAAGFGMAGVILLSIYTGHIPLNALLIAGTFGFYGLTKKKTTISSLTSLFWETLLLSPIAWYYLHFYAETSYFTYPVSEQFLLLVSGILTVIPLFLFSIANKNSDYVTLGFIQYIGPSIMLFLAIFIFGEHFSTIQLLGFVLIWTGIGIYLWFTKKEE
ncbi:EamA family transporter RarD [Enterococcus crotali]|uniref:EamA family transporter RarD n=1 Tax=Enterococcus crotali TaxID=1453587 RepID=UPI000470E6E7|nr:EamA family transporter RarD [Enterococcus crotali]OTP50442.1 hypothetical protein A5881_001866 [Enterococcus termitis]